MPGCGANLLQSACRCALASPPHPTPGTHGAPAVQFGYYSLLAASMGCRVVAWEPVPFFAAYFKYGLLRNNLTHLVEVRARLAG